jgi:hypothetical protein
LLPHGHPGQLLNNDVRYIVLPLEDNEHTYAFAICREGQHDPYQVTVKDWTCTCPDTVYRGRQCKHATALRTAFEGKLP